MTLCNIWITLPKGWSSYGANPPLQFVDVRVECIFLYQGMISILQNPKVFNTKVDDLDWILKSYQKNIMRGAEDPLDMVRHLLQVEYFKGPLSLILSHSSLYILAIYLKKQTKMGQKIQKNKEEKKRQQTLKGKKRLDKNATPNN